MVASVQMHESLSVCCVPSLCMGEHTHTTRTQHTQGERPLPDVVTGAGWHCGGDSCGCEHTQCGHLDTPLPWITPTRVVKGVVLRAGHTASCNTTHTYGIKFFTASAMSQSHLLTNTFDIYIGHVFLTKHLKQYYIILHCTIIAQQC